jgi:hypothetical protein
MVWPTSKAEESAQKGAKIGAKLGSKAGPLGAGIGAGFGSASGYIAGSFVPECPAKKVLPDGGRTVEDRKHRGVEIPVEEE